MAWMNVQYLKSLPIEEFQELAAPYLADVKEALAADPEYARQALAMARERIHGLADIASTGLYFFTDEFDTDAAGAAKHLSNAGAFERMAQLRTALAALPEWTAANIEGAIRELATKLEIKPAELIHPCRLLVSGRTVGPSLWELLEVLGHERVLRRLEKRPAH
jgi:glutamyl/glutaminyl-tRNA synthetase